MPDMNIAGFCQNWRAELPGIRAGLTGLQAGLAGPAFSRQFEKQYSGLVLKGIIFMNDMNIIQNNTFVKDIAAKSTLYVIYNIYIYI